jgi:hypothetical protein
MAARILNEKNYDTLMKLEGLAQRSGHSMLDLAIGWLASLPHVGSVIAGATKPEQVEQNVRAVEYRLNPEELKEVDDPGRRPAPAPLNIAPDAGRAAPGPLVETVASIRSLFAGRAFSPARTAQPQIASQGDTPPDKACVRPG